ncbi:unnamed protein product, partial [Bubo scandiacus]
MVRQAVPLQPMEVHGGAEIYLQPVEGPTPEQYREFGDDLNLDPWCTYVTIQSLITQLHRKFPHDPSFSQYTSWMVLWDQISYSVFLFILVIQHPHYSDLANVYKLIWKQRVSFRQNKYYPKEYMGWRMTVSVHQLSRKASEDYSMPQTELDNIHSVLKKECIQLDLQTEIQPEKQKTVLLLSAKRASSVFGILYFKKVKTIHMRSKRI